MTQSSITFKADSWQQGHASIWAGLDVGLSLGGILIDEDANVVDLYLTQSAATGFLIVTVHTWNIAQYATPDITAAENDAAINLETTSLWWARKWLCIGGAFIEVIMPPGLPCIRKTFLVTCFANWGYFLASLLRHLDSLYETSLAPDRLRLSLGGVHLQGDAKIQDTLHRLANSSRAILRITLSMQKPMQVIVISALTGELLLDRIFGDDITLGDVRQAVAHVLSQPSQAVQLMQGGRMLQDEAEALPLADASGTIELTMALLKMVQVRVLFKNEGLLVSLKLADDWFSQASSLRRVRRYYDEKPGLGEYLYADPDEIIWSAIRCPTDIMQFAAAVRTRLGWNTLLGEFESKELYIVYDHDHEELSVFTSRLDLCAWSMQARLKHVEDSEEGCYCYPIDDPRCSANQCPSQWGWIEPLSLQ